MLAFFVEQQMSLLPWTAGLSDMLQADGSWRHYIEWKLTSLTGGKRKLYETYSSGQALVKFPVMWSRDFKHDAVKSYY